MKSVLLSATVLMMLIAGTVMAQVQMDSVSMDPPYIQAGSDVKIFVKYHEILSKKDVYSVQVRDQELIPKADKPDLYYAARLVPKDEATQQYILIMEGDRDVGHLFPGESWTTPMKIHISDNAPPTNYTLAFEVYKRSMNDSGLNEIILSKDIPVVVSGVPKFTMSSDNQLNAGESKDFKISVANLGGGVASLVTVGLNATAPLTVLGSSSVYAGDMPSQSFKSFNFQLYVDSKADPKAYTLPVEIKYTDREGAAQTVTKLIGVKVQGAPQVMASLDNFDDMKGGMTGKVTLSVANNGFVEAKFLSMSLADTDQYTVTSKSSVYIGNLASDDFQSEDFKIQVKDGVEGKIPLKMNIAYTEENNNQQHSVDTNIMLNVMSPQEYETAHPTTNGNQQLTYVLIGVPALIVAYVLLWLLFKVVGALTGVIDKKIFRRQ